MISSFILQVMAFKSQPISSREGFASYVAGVHRVLVRSWYLELSGILHYLLALEKEWKLRNKDSNLFHCLSKIEVLIKSVSKHLWFFSQFSLFYCLSENCELGHVMLYFPAASQHFHWASRMIWQAFTLWITSSLSVHTESLEYRTSVYTRKCFPSPELSEPFLGLWQGQLSPLLSPSQDVCWGNDVKHVQPTTIKSDVNDNSASWSEHWKETLTELPWMTLIYKIWNKDFENKLYRGLLLASSQLSVLFKL